MTTRSELAPSFGAFGAVPSDLMKRRVALRLFAASANAFFNLRAVSERNWLFRATQTALLAIGLYGPWDALQPLRSPWQATRTRRSRTGCPSQTKAGASEPARCFPREGCRPTNCSASTFSTIRSPQSTDVLGAGQRIGEIGSPPRTRRPRKPAC